MCQAFGNIKTKFGLNIIYQINMLKVYCPNLHVHLVRRDIFDIGFHTQNCLSFSPAKLEIKKTGIFSMSFLITNKYMYMTIVRHKGDLS